jgi:DTW domain-containing protein YfiP
MNVSVSNVNDEDIDNKADVVLNEQLGGENELQFLVDSTCHTANETETVAPTQLLMENDCNKKQKRSICLRCDRPLCICSALPVVPINLQHCHIIVLQHPHETKTKNSSLPLIKLCFDSSSVTIISGRRFGSPSLMDIIRSKLSQQQQRQRQQQHNTQEQPIQEKGNEIIGNTIVPDNETNISVSRVATTTNGNDDVDFDVNANAQEQDLVIWLVFPTDDAISLSHAIDEECHKRQQPLQHDMDTTNSRTNVSSSDTTNVVSPLFIVFLDATWKYAREMDRSNIQHGQYPPTMQRVQLSEFGTTNFIPRRFERIRTPISDQHLSTAECIAHVVQMVESKMHQHFVQQLINTKNPDKCNEIDSHQEHNQSIFDVIMKPLDLMVQQCSSFLNNHEKKRRTTQQKQSTIIDSVKSLNDN